MRFRADRRDFLRSAACGALGASALLRTGSAAGSVIPVVGDGRWIWTAPPERERGYLEPRRYRLSVGIELEGIGGAADIISTTTVPVEYPEQKIESVELETDGCDATLRTLTPTAGQLLLTASGIERGQKVIATAHFTLELFKQYFAWQRDQFPAKQNVPAQVRGPYLQDSPGIQTSSKQVKQLAAELTSGVEPHPWSYAEKFADWIPQNIRPQVGPYTSVTTAIDSRRGDCEEMAGVFVALCRAVQIPARLVWVPNHAWAEFFLIDHDDHGHWIPAHTACYPWFGFTGAHELVLQKGDRVYQRERGKTMRLMDDWLRAAGRLPKPRYTAELTPLPKEPAGDPGPGARKKDDRGDWKPVGQHALDKYVRR
ncbi:MAG TPA: transglutaminase domain-containing protein [Pirellulales bacterium]|nr:transglutaminase domain-containing protein [Pirellulales bacterium]